MVKVLAFALKVYRVTQHHLWAAMATNVKLTTIVLSKRLVWASNVTILAQVLVVMGLIVEWNNIIRFVHVMPVSLEILEFSVMPWMCQRSPRTHAYPARAD